jgi:hypothetical protein
MERNEMKKITYRVWFEIYFDLAMWTSSKQQCFLVATLIPKSCKLTSQVHGYRISKGPYWKQFQFGP